MELILLVIALLILNVKAIEFDELLSKKIKGNTKLIFATELDTGAFWYGYEDENGYQGDYRCEQPVYRGREYDISKVEVKEPRSVLKKDLKVFEIYSDALIHILFEDPCAPQCKGDIDCIVQCRNEKQQKQEI